MLNGPCYDVQPTPHPINVELPNGETITSTHTGLLPFQNLPTEAKRAHIFPSLTSGSLVSMGVLCDAGCTVTLDKDQVVITNGNLHVTTGQRTRNGLWNLDFARHTPRANLATLAIQTASDRIAFLHAAAGYPVVSTWIRAIQQGFFTTWPGLTTQTVKQYLPKSLITALGHLDQTRSNARSTKPRKPNNVTTPDTAPKLTDTIDDPDLNTRRHYVYVDCEPITGKIYSDLPGRFIAPSSRGNNYLLIVYDYDSNAILAEPMKNRQGKTITQAYEKIHKLLVSRGLRPILQRLDNEASVHLRTFLTAEHIDWQLVPPHVHRRNAAERAIRTYKNHFVTILCGADPDFPIHLWDRLLPQTLLTLNLLRASRINPRLSAYAQLHGAFDFNRTPLGPLGTKVLTHEKPAVRESWAPHGDPGWYIGLSAHHYRCYQIYSIETGAERTTDTLSWFPKHVRMPQTSSADAATSAARDLIHALRNPAPATPFSQLDNTELSALDRLAAIFHQQTVSKDASLPRVEANKQATVDKSKPDIANHPAPEPTPGPTVPKPATPTAADQPAKPHAGTYGDATQNPGKRRRAAKPKKTAPKPFPETPAQHHHNTRFEANRHKANHAAATQRATHRTAYANHIPRYYAHSVIDPDTGEQREYKHLIRGKDAPTWLNGGANEVARLAQGRRGSNIVGTNTIRFIPHTDLPEGRTATYLRIVVSVRPQKAEPNRVRWTVGGNLIDYPGNVSTPTAGITTAKLVFNSVVSTPRAIFSAFDIGNFYLGTPLHRPEFMRIPVWALPQCIIDEYELEGLIHNGYVLVEINKGMYGLPQAGLIAYERLVLHLAKYGYHPARHTDGLWRHETRPILFSLVVDDFGIQSIGRADAEHLLAALRDLYTVTVDWAGTKYLGLTLKWDYINRSVILSMPGYVDDALHRFQHTKPAYSEDSPHAWTKPTYGAPVQLTPLADTSAALDRHGITKLQQVIGTLLYYARAIDSTMLVTLGTLASAQSKGTEQTAKAVTRLLNYAASHNDAAIEYKASDMVLYIHSDASYLSESKARSRVGGHFYLSSKPTDPTRPPNAPVPNNGAVHTTATILKNVMSSVAEAELGGLFLNAKDGTVLATTLKEMGWPQPPTPIQTDNSCASGIANGTLRQRKSKAMDMRFYWIQDRVKQGHFLVYWRPGSTNLADYFTKHHPTAHHRAIRPTYLHVATQRPSVAHHTIQTPIPYTARVCSFPSGFPPTLYPSVLSPPFIRFHELL
jgi:hypothetical protein